MPTHLAACYQSVDASAGYVALNALSDPLLRIIDDTKLRPPVDMLLLAAAAGGTGITRARIEAPGLLRVAWPAIVPLNGATTVGSYPAVCDLSDRPVRLAAGEDFQVAVCNASADYALGLLVLGRDLTPAPPGEAFWVRYSKSATTTAAGAWTQFGAAELDWEQDLPAGTYAVVGMDHIGPTAMAARLIWPDSRYRPGVLAHISAAASFASPLFQGGRLGVMGTFTHELPGVEVLCTGDDATFEGLLRVVRIGR